MPPKPRPRKASTASKSTKDAVMPPPPVPLPPQGILEPEMNALQGCLRNAIVKTGQMYDFYADTHRLGIRDQAPNPPRSLVASLGREVEKYDQLCDAMESHLLRAIAVLQRDITREQTRLKEIEMAAKAKVLETANNSEPQDPEASASQPSLFSNPLFTFNQSKSGTSSIGDASSPTQPQLSPPPPSGALAPANAGRRPSAISLSSLHRPPFPHKLDLSAAALRMGDELSQSALASPVTLAPKSARPIANSEFPPDFMSALASASERPVDIDLTSSPDLGNPSNSDRLEAGAGSSADKPIELDLDMDVDIDMSQMSDLFGDSGPSNGHTNQPSVQDLFGRANSSNMNMGRGLGNEKDNEQERLGMEILDALSAAGDQNENDALFASLQSSNSIGQGMGQNQNHLQAQSQMGGNGNQASSSSSMPSPGSILASFNASSHRPDDINHMPLVSSSPFDMGALDLSSLPADFGFYGNNTDEQQPNINYSDMEALFNMDGGGGDAQDGS